MPNTTLVAAPNLKTLQHLSLEHTLILNLSQYVCEKEELGFSDTVGQQIESFERSFQLFSCW